MALNTTTQLTIEHDWARRLAETTDYTDAARALKDALSIYHDLRDRIGEAIALTELGKVLYLTDE